ncbi:MAG: ferredoxin [Clostridiaceae bacterium]
MATIDSLAKIKEENLERVNQDTNRKTTRIVVGMATCGVSAGAAPVYEAILDEVNKLGLSNVTVCKTGCIGICRLEPIVDIIKPGEEKVTYVKMTPYKGRRVVAKHIFSNHIIDEYTMHVIKGKILNDFTLDNE